MYKSQIITHERIFLKKNRNILPNRLKKDVNQIHFMDYCHGCNMHAMLQPFM